MKMADDKPESSIQEASSESEEIQDILNPNDVEAAEKSDTPEFHVPDEPEIKVPDPNIGVIIGAIIQGVAAILAAILVVVLGFYINSNQTSDSQTVSTSTSSQIVLISEPTISSSPTLTPQTTVVVASPELIPSEIVIASETNSAVSVAQIASTPSEVASQVSENTVTPTASSEPSPGATTDLAIQTDVPGCTTTPLLDDNEFDLTIIRDEDSLVLYLDEEQINADLSRIGFEFVINDVRDRTCLKDIFDFVADAPITGPVCLRLMRQDTTPVLSRVCERESIDYEVSSGDVFWYRSQALSFSILMDDTIIDFCGTPSSSVCNIHIGSSLPPTFNSATVNLTWEAAYLAVYIKETGIFNLDGLRITHSSSVRGSILQEEAAFANLDFTQIRAPICFYYTTPTSDGTLPPDCDANRRIIQYVSESGVFWQENHNNRLLYVFIQSTPIGTICLYPDSCTRQLP